MSTSRTTDDSTPGGLALCPALRDTSADADQIAPAGRSAVPTIPVLPRSISRPIRPPAHLPPIRLTDLVAERRGDTTEQGWRDLDAPAGEALGRTGRANAFVPGPSGVRSHAAAAKTALVARVARAQAVGAVIVSLLAALLALGDTSEASWALALAVLIGAGAATAYLLLQRRGNARAHATVVLLGSQLGVLVWALGLIGARPALLAFVPALAALALRLRGRGGALGSALAALMLYLAFAAVQAHALFGPALSMSDATRTLLDAGLAIAGLLLTQVALLALHGGELRARRLAERRRRDARDLLSGYTLLQQSVRRDAARLEQTLAAALRGEEVERVASHVAEPALYQLAELLDLATDRLQTLHRDREDRVRLEGALRRLGRTLDHMERGVPPTWPEPSGTLVDQLVAGLQRLHPDLGASPPDEGRFRSMGKVSGAPASPRPIRGRTTGIILSWRPSRVAARQNEEPMRIGPGQIADYGTWPPVSSGDEDHSPA